MDTIQIIELYEQVIADEKQAQVDRAKKAVDDIFREIEVAASNRRYGLSLSATLYGSYGLEFLSEVFTDAGFEVREIKDVDDEKKLQAITITWY